MAEPVKLTKKQVNIPWGAVIIAGAVVVLGLFILINSLLKSDTVNCSSMTCFSKEFSVCHPAIWKFQDYANYPGAEAYYKVNGKVGNRCSLTQYNSVVSSVKLTCNLNYKDGFTKAESELYTSPKKYDCHKS